MSVPHPTLLASLKALPRPAWILFFGTFLNKFGTFVLPFLTLYLTRQGYSLGDAGLAIGAYGVGTLLASALGGHLADTIGRRKTIVLSMFFAAITMLLLSQARGLAAIVALTAVAGLVLVLSVNLQRSRAGRAWMAIRDREIAAESVGIDVARYKVLAFVWSSALTSVAGALFAYQRAFVSVEAFGFFLAIEYIAMVIIGGLGSALGAVLGAAFVTLLPYGIDAGVAALRVPGGAEYYLFPLKFGAFGLLMAAFLIFEPQGLVGVWRRVRNWVFLWPLRYRPLRSAS